MSYPIEENIFYIFTDGSCRPVFNEKLKRKSWRYWWKWIWFVYYDENFEQQEDDESDYISCIDATISDMELQACIDGLKIAYNRDLSRFLKVMVISDSTFLKDGAYNAQGNRLRTKRYWKYWEPIKHVEQRKELVKIMQKFFNKHRKFIYFDWVEAHAGNEFNEKADKSAWDWARSKIKKQRGKTLSRSKFLKSKPGKIGMAWQEILIHIIWTTWFKQQKTNKYKYEVVSRDSPYFMRINDIYFEKYLSAEKIYKVKFSDDDKNRFVVDIISIEEKEDIKKQIINAGFSDDIFFWSKK